MNNLEDLLKNLPQHTLPDNFSKNVIQQINIQEKKEYSLLKKMFYCTWIILSIVVGNLFFWSMTEASNNGVFEFIDLYRQNSNNQNAGEIMQVIINLLPITQLLLSCFFISLIIFTFYIYKKMNYNPS